MIAAVFAGAADAQTITVTTKDDKRLEIPYVKDTIRKNYLDAGSGGKLTCADVKKISTDHFEAYERAMVRTSRKICKDVKVVFTGDENIYAKQMEKLQKARKRAHNARGAGGIMMLIGALAGSRELVAAGAVTYGAGNIARDVNTEKTLAVQNQAILELQEKQQAESQAVRLEAELRREYGNENVDGLIALIDGNHRRALALALAGETSPDPVHQLGALWLIGMIHADQKDEAALEADYERIAADDPEIDSVQQATKEIASLMADLASIREDRRGA